MSVPYYGDFAEDDTVDIPFNTFTSDDPSASSTITNLINTDIHIHKDGGLTQRNNAAGITVSVDFDGITGNHLVKIDTSDDTVAEFWVTGSEYQVRMEGTTVDGATINAWIGAFSIERAGGVIALLKLIQAAVITNAAGTDIAADIIAVKAETASILDDTDLIDDGTSGLAKIAGDVADILTDTGSTLDTLIKDIPTTDEFEARSDLAGTAATPAEVATALTTYDAPTKAEMDTAHALLATVAKQDVIDGIVDNILIDTAVIGALGAGLTAIPWNSDWDAEVQSECKDALDAYDPPTRTELTTDKNSIITEINANETKIDALNDIAASDVWDATVNETTAGAAPTTAKGKLQAIWNRLFGKKTVTASLETAYEKDDAATMETWDLADDDTTASRTR